MPAMPRDMSWLSPKRRRTTGNLKALPNGQVPNGVDAPPTSPPPSVPSTPTPEQRPKAPRPTSQPVVRRATSSAASSAGGDGGNLFYAYARKGDDPKSRYLLTFASAGVANEWWLHVQANFPDSSRPGPQLFSFRTDDLLAKAWRHPSLEHLKSKWMYIAFSDAPGDVGGAAQGIIPVQDAEGNMLGNSAGRESGVVGEMKREAKQVKNEVQRLEEHFEKMMEAVEKNTERVAELAERRAGPATDYLGGGAKVGPDGSGITYFDMDVLSGHFGRMNDLLAKNNAHIDGLVRKHDEHEQQLRGTLQVLASRRNTDQLDLQQLSAHLDRIQHLMQASVAERKDSANDVSERPPQIDFSPLTDRLEKVQEAVEQNSALVKALLDEGAGGDSRPGTPFWGREQTAPDLLPLTAHLERIHAAIERQNEHTERLVGLASGERDAPDGQQQPTSLAPLVAEHLEQIYNAVEEGNRHAAGSRDDLRQLLASQDRLREATEAHSGREHFEKMSDALQEGNRHTVEVGRHLETLLQSQGPIRVAMEESNRHAEESKDHLQRLLESQIATREAIKANGGEIDFTPMAEHLEAIRESSDTNAGTIQRLLEAQQATHRDLDFAPLSDHLGAIRSATEQNSAQFRELVTSQHASAPSDFTPVTERLQKIHTTLEKQAAERRAASPTGGTGDPHFLLTALSSHLSKIQAVTEQNATHVRSLREAQRAGQDATHGAVAAAAAQVHALADHQGAAAERLAGAERRLDAQTAQMRELMSGQREMVEVVRSLARGVSAQSQGACDHVVVPPPRKMGRKVVGFVYDAKENGG